MEQLAARQELITNKHLIEAAAAVLYYDADAGKNKQKQQEQGTRKLQTIGRRY